MIDDHKLINAVLARPELYNRFSAGYKSRKIKLANWKGIAEELSNDNMPAISFESIIGRWHCLRERYTREVRKLEKEGNTISHSKWPYFDAMSFLLPLLRKRKTYSRRTDKFYPETSRSPSPEFLKFNKRDQFDAEKSTERTVVDSKESPNPVQKSDEKKRSCSSSCEVYNISDPDYLIGKSVECVLKSLGSSSLTIEYRRKFRNLISECEEHALHYSIHGV